MVPISGAFLPWVPGGGKMNCGKIEDKGSMGHPNPTSNPQRCCWVQPTPVSAVGDGVGVGMELGLGLGLRVGDGVGVRVGLGG